MTNFCGPVAKTKCRVVKVHPDNEEIILKSDIALILADVRLTRGWTKKRLAQELKISPSALTKLESGQQFRLWERTWARMVGPLAQLLRVEPGELEHVGKELIGEVYLAQPSVTPSSTSIVDVLAADPRLDKAGKRFVLEAYQRAIRAG